MPRGYETRSPQSSEDTKSVPHGTHTLVVSFRMDFLKPRLAELGKTAAAFAKALGLPKARAYEMQKGERKLQTSEIGPAARFLEWTETELNARLEGRMPTNTARRHSNHEADIKSSRPLRESDKPLQPLTIYRTVSDIRGRGDGFMLSALSAGEVERPEFLRHSEKAFAARVLDDRNAPAYRRRDLILVDPDSPPIEMEDCLFTGDPEAGGVMAVIGCLIRSTTNLWIIRQYAVKGDRELSRGEYPNAWPIVGRYNRR